MKRSRLLFTALVIGLTSVALLGLYVYNLRSVRAASETIYRAGQITEADLRRAAEELGVRTVINLRGDNPKSEWYQEEVQACRDLGLEYVEYRFESFDHPPQYETRMLVRDLTERPRSILVHCRSGHDRSGWAAAVGRILDGEDPETAIDEELSLLEGHLCVRETCSLHGFFDLYEAHLNQAGSTHTPEAFREWALHEYAPGKYNAEISVVERPEMPVPAGGTARFVLEVTNDSPEDWPAGGDRTTGVRLGARTVGPWSDRPENELRMFRRFRSPAIDRFRATNGPLPAGESTRIEIELPVPDEPGNYTIQFDMVEEGVAWFSEHGNPGAFEVLRVE